MKVILLKDIKGTGKKGQVIEASDGHARNYLFPRGLAKPATDSSVRELEHQKASADKRKEKEVDVSKALAQQLEAISLKFAVKIGEGGKLFGSITTKDVAEALEKQHGIKIDKKKLELVPIKSTGTTHAEAKLAHGVHANIKIEVVEG
ncbi:50S ribosomal protein L9 [Acidaminobacter sp.]|uniref:50S ribosomal protein L9 n=1 Tax=Acidaminobacter sp. TaxID=1872102 RepID=UPI00137E7390|nr:50S ribosomal protein L9 [Acidaminobacter sp.]MDK9710214.1 50S ribosomal protein L9 [Acidaminobacter sp.]MZQ98700.1 50S ribosomal protein L9 [Acidaminobacter sp.]